MTDTTDTPRFTKSQYEEALYEFGYLPHKSTMKPTAPPKDRTTCVSCDGPISIPTSSRHPTCEFCE